MGTGKSEKLNGKNTELHCMQSRLLTDFIFMGSRQRLASLEGKTTLSLFHTDLEKVHSVKYLTWDDLISSIRQNVWWEGLTLY